MRGILGKSGMCETLNLAVERPPSCTFSSMVRAPLDVSVIDHFLVVFARSSPNARVGTRSRIDPSSHGQEFPISTKIVFYLEGDTVNRNGCKRLGLFSDVL